MEGRWQRNQLVENFEFLIEYLMCTVLNINMLDVEHFGFINGRRLSTKELEFTRKDEICVLFLRTKPSWVFCGVVGFTRKTPPKHPDKFRLQVEPLQSDSETRNE